MRTLGSEYFNYDEARRTVIGSRSGTMYRMGDPVEVKLVEAAPLAGALRFEMLSDGRVLPRKDRGKPPGKAAGKAGRKDARRGAARGKARRRSGAAGARGRQ
jgi:ribonuclease R